MSGAEQAPGREKGLDSFLRRFRQDEGLGRVRPLRDYLLLFPDDDARIARAYARLTDPEGEPSSSISSDGLSGTESFGRFRNLEEIGRGGQGIVYKAHDSELGRYVALKVLRDLGPGPEYEQLRARFQREANVAARMDHPNICTVYEAGVIGNIPYISFEFVQGFTMSSMISKAKTSGQSDITTYLTSPGSGDFPTQLAEEDHDSGASGESTSSGPTARAEINRVVQVIERVAMALHYAHEMGVIHRDIKPANIMLEADGDPKVLDFGLAHAEDPELMSLTASGDFFGTPAYMSPEQLARRGIQLDRRSDVYSLGVTLYEALACERPFDGPTREAMYQAILWKEAPDVRKVNPSVPDDLRVIVQAAMEKDRDRRYQTALAFAEDLRRFRTLEPIHARPITNWLRVRRWAQRNPAIASCLLLVFLLLSSGLVVVSLLLEDSRQSEREAVQATQAKTEALQSYEQMADVVQLENRIGEAGALWPRRRAVAPRMEAWLVKAGELLERRTGHASALAALEVRAEGEGPGGQRLFSDPRDTFRYRTFRAVLADFERLAALIADVRRRRQQVDTIEKVSIEDAKQAWKACLDSLAAGRAPYPNLRLAPIAGLVPLGRDNATGLWEFWHVGSGERPEWKGTLESGRLTGMGAGMGLVLVLLPGGTTWMGAQSTDPEGRLYDEQARADETPCEVTLSPFLVSKYELTQAQWARLADGARPSKHQAGVAQEGTPEITETNPVEQISWNDCQEFLPRWDLSLPTEAQWEYAARGGEQTPWNTGRDVTSLQDACNVADATANRSYGWPGTTELDDGYGLHAPVGSFAPNGFGLYDVHGNVQEWCLDRYTPYEVEARYGDGLRSDETGVGGRVQRGGGYYWKAEGARLAYRNHNEPANKNAGGGCRPVLRLDRP